MNEGSPSPSYIRREEERLILEEAVRVRADHRSRAVLLRGQGGMGKTWLVRELIRAGEGDKTTIWLDPIDVDDPEYWLLSNLERWVAAQLDPEDRHFAPYSDFVSKLSRYMQPRIGHETVVSHLGRIKRIFGECYQGFVQETGKTVVLTLDTVEAIRGVDHLMLTLTQWIKPLPGTLFILSGRPPFDEHDPIRRELEDPRRGLPVTIVDLAGFTEPTALEYLDQSPVAGALSREEKHKIAHLTHGHPLWLAFTLDYLLSVGMPEEAERDEAEIRQDLPYLRSMTPKGRRLQEDFKRRLVSPYRETDFWHEATKRLAVIRHRVNQPIWEGLMRDLHLPDGVATWEEAWHRLFRLPWIRPRANGRYVTLHDAVAEELARRIVPLHDQDQHWRRRLWQRAIDVYGKLTEEPGAELERQIDETLRSTDPLLSPEESGPFIERMAQLEDRKREIDQLRAAGLHYQLLLDPAEGCRRFQALFRRAIERHDVLFQQLIVLEMQRFLPGQAGARVFSDVTRAAIERVQEWLTSTSPHMHLEVALSIAEYQMENEQAEAAMALLDKEWTPEPEPGQRYRMSLLQGNACLRIPGRVRDGEGYLQQALRETAAMTSPGRNKLVARAHKEMGFYYRLVGRWQEADEAYCKARDAISETLSLDSSPEDRLELASIQTNWAYVKGLGGDYRQGENLVRSAITVRRRFGRVQEEGVSWSVLGEVHRFDHQFQKAWAAYIEAERIFQGVRSWPWLGLVYQQQAICLVQAAQEGVDLVQNIDQDPYQRAELLIELALDICRENAVRGYPSALNRAGRIVGEKDFSTALSHLQEAIQQAKQLSDGWFWLASLVELVELTYRAWLKTGQEEYRDQIHQRAAEIEEALREYEFSDLAGRWDLVQGHLIVHDAVQSGQQSRLPEALEHYKKGFVQITQGFMGSHGMASIPIEFERFKEIFRRLERETQASWQDELRRAWEGNTSLLARLEELY